MPTCHNTHAFLHECLLPKPVCASYLRKAPDDQVEILDPEFRQQRFHGALPDQGENPGPAGLERCNSSRQQLDRGSRKHTDPNGAGPARCEPLQLIARLGNLAQHGARVPDHALAVGCRNDAARRTLEQLQAQPPLEFAQHLGYRGLGIR